MKVLRGTPRHEDMISQSRKNILLAMLDIYIFMRRLFRSYNTIVTRKIKVYSDCKSSWLSIYVTAQAGHEGLFSLLQVWCTETYYES